MPPGLLFAERLVERRTFPPALLACCGSKSPEVRFHRKEMQTRHSFNGSVSGISGNGTMRVLDISVNAHEFGHTIGMGSL